MKSADLLEAKAREIVDQLRHNTNFPEMLPVSREVLRRAILAALREERERAAKIADEYERASRASYEKIKNIADGVGFLKAANQALAIAAAIRAAIRGKDNG